MAKLDLSGDTAEQFIERLNQVQSETQRRWGTMGPEKLIQHLTYVLKASLGEETAEKVFVPMPSFVIWLLFFNWFTNWPQAKLQAPDSFFPDSQGDLARAKAECVDWIQRFVNALNTAPDQQGFSPLLGNIPLSKWARVHGVHMDHHLRQYGV